MDASVIVISIVLYMLSAAGYLAYLLLQKNALQRAGFFLLLAGFVCHTGAILLEMVRLGHIPVSNLHETLSFAGWAVAGVFIVLHYLYGLKILGVVAAPFVALIMVIVSLLPDEPAKTTAIFKSFWPVSHVTVIFIGEGRPSPCRASAFCTSPRKTPSRRSGGASFSSACPPWTSWTRPGTPASSWASRC